MHNDPCMVTREIQDNSQFMSLMDMRSYWSSQLF